LFWYILNGIDQLEAALTTKTKQTNVQNELKSADAKLFWNGRSQAVRLPKEFRFVGDRVRVSRMGAGVLLEPVPGAQREPIEELFTRMDAMGGDPIFRQGRKGADLVAAMQASPYKETNLEPDRARLPVRKVQF
jgi:antitoxin VapB